MTYKLNRSGYDKLRMSKQRKAILKALRSTKNHPTAEEIYNRLKSEIPHISLGTVYRNLEMLCDLGMVVKLEQGSGQRRYDYNTKPHHHIFCINCNRVDDIGIETPLELIGKMKVHSDYDITGYNLSFYGLCPDCREDIRHSDMSDDRE